MSIGYVKRDASGFDGNGNSIHSGQKQKESSHNLSEHLNIMIGERVWNLSAGEFPQYPKQDNSMLVGSSRANSKTKNSCPRMSGSQSLKKSRFEIETVQDSQWVSRENPKIMIKSA